MKSVFLSNAFANVWTMVIIRGDACITLFTVKASEWFRDLANITGLIRL
jgi:hypothetical protein